MKLKPVEHACFIDRFVLAFPFIVRGGANMTDDDLAIRLRPHARITTPPSERAEGYIQIEIALFTDDDHPAGKLRVNLHGRRQGDDLCFGDRSSIEGNSLVALRGVLGGDSCGPASFEGKTNLLGPWNQTPANATLQMTVIRDMVQHIVDLFSEVFGSAWQPQETWIKTIELCRDLRSDNSLADIRIIQHATLCDTLERRWDEYRRLGAVERHSIPTLRLITHVDGPELKIYAKRADSIRIELAFPNRKSVASATGSARAAFAGDAAAALLTAFLNSFTCRIDQAERHVRSALEGEVSIAELLCALKPLVDRASGTSKVKGPPSPTAQPVAFEALNSLLSVGFFDAKGLDANHAIRRDLDNLRSANGPLEKHKTRAVYYLKSKFARACSAIVHSSDNLGV